VKVLLSVGCDYYTSMPRLFGAERDAARIFEALVDSRSGYSPEESRLLRSPSLSDVTEFFAGISRKSKGIDVFTFFFAGHGSTKAGTYYLGLRESDYSSLSTSALSVVWLLALFAEARIRQVNLIMDACESGGAMLDAPTLLKRDVIGVPGSSSVSFLAASGISEYAEETLEGGVLTSHLLSYVQGSKTIQSARPFLGLVEVGRCVSDDISAVSKEQVPVTWGLNLYGQGEFAANPHFAQEQGSITLAGIPPNSSLGERIYRHSEILWREYRLIAEEQSARRLWQIIRSVAGGLSDEPNQLWSFVRGLSTTLRARVASSQDLLAEYNVLATCALGLLPDSDGEGVELLVLDFAKELSAIARNARAELLDGLQRDPYILLSPRGIFGNLFYLPLRISRLLGWIGLSCLVDEIMGIGRESDKEECKRLVEIVVDTYKGSLVALSEEQAPYVYLFSKSASIWGGEALASDVVESTFDGMVAIEGRVSRAGLQPEQALSYLLMKAQDFKAIDYELLGRPSQLLAVLLLCSGDLGLSKRVDSLMITLDGEVAYVFLPNDYTSFADEIIEDGSSILYAIGRDIWRVKDFTRRFGLDVRASTSSDRGAKGRHVWMLCLLASYLFPDRVPFFWEVANLFGRESVI